MEGACKSVTPGAGDQGKISLEPRPPGFRIYSPPLLVKLSFFRGFGYGRQGAFVQTQRLHFTFRSIVFVDWHFFGFLVDPEIVRETRFPAVGGRFRARGGGCPKGRFGGSHPFYRKTKGQRWGAKPPTVSSRFCGRRGPPTPLKTSISEARCFK